MKNKTLINLYFPLVDGRPGVFCKTQICYADKHNPVSPVKSLCTVKSQILKSIRYRVENNYDVVRSEYDYQRIQIDLSMLTARKEDKDEK